MMKGTVTGILLLFVVVSVVYMAVGQRGEGNGAATKAEVSEASASQTVQKTAMEGTRRQEIAEPVEGGAAAPNAPDEPATKSQGPTEVPRTVVAYYFHGTQRCHTCLTMEAYARGALKERLSDALQSGQLQFRSVNVDETANEHFVKEYDLYASALVLVEMAGDEVKRSKKLKEIWDLVGDEPKFKAYVRDEALAYLEGTP